MITKYSACLGKREDAVELTNDYIAQLKENKQLQKAMSTMERGIPQNSLR
jgi:hypothetical protein